MVPVNVSNAAGFRKLLLIPDRGCQRKVGGSNVPLHKKTLRLWCHAAARLRACSSGPELLAPDGSAPDVFVRLAGLLPPDMQSTSAQHALIFCVHAPTRGGQEQLFVSTASFASLLQAAAAQGGLAACR